MLIGTCEPRSTAFVTSAWLIGGEP